MLPVSLVYEFNGRFQALSGTLPSGDRGTQRTLEYMQAMAVEGAKQMVVRETAINVVRAAGAPEHNLLAQLGALFRFVRDSVMFIGDVAGVETLQSPRYTLHVMAGDCDDRATLMVALARSIGIPTSLKFRVIAANPKFPRSFSHVYVVARVNGKDIALDPTYHQNALGFEYPGAFRTGDFAL